MLRPQRALIIISKSSLKADKANYALCKQETCRRHARVEIPYHGQSPKKANMRNKVFRAIGSLRRTNSKCLLLQLVIVHATLEEAQFVNTVCKTFHNNNKKMEIQAPTGWCFVLHASLKIGFLIESLLTWRE